MNKPVAEIEHYSDDPLKPWELKRIRKLLSDRDRIKWLWTTVRLWLYYVSAFTAGVVLFQENLIKIFKRLLP